MKKYICMLLLLAFVSGFSNAQIIELKEESSEIWIQEKDMSFYEDPGCNMTIGSISDPSFQAQFKTPEDGSPPVITHHKSEYWLRITLRNKTKNASKWLLEYFDLNTNYINFYEADSEGDWREYETGNFLPFSKKQIRHKNFEFFLHLKPGEQKTYFIKFKSENNNLMKPVIRSYPAFINYALSEYYALGIFYGILILIALYNLFFFIAVRTKAYVYHILYIVSVMLYSLSNDGMGFQYLWPNHPGFNHYCHSFALLAMELSALVFTISFLEIKKRSRLTYKIFLGLIAIYVLRFAIGVSTNGFPIMEGIWDTLPLFAAFGAGVYFYFKLKYVPARYFVLAYIFLFAGFTVSLLEHMGIMDSSVYTFYSLNFAILVEVIFLSFALVHQVRRTVVEKEEAQSQLLEEMKIKEELKDRHNKELEHKVTERTKELDEQKKLVELKNESITSSITYAKNIQNAILPADKDIKGAFPDSFVYYRPRDIVSGDFYYFANHKGNNIIAVVDCTGHGVPGGFMSMIGYSLLNQSIYNNNNLEPGKILDELHDGVVEGLRQADEDNPVKDGMDMSLFSIDQSDGMLKFSGANNPLFIVRDMEIITLKANRQPIGDVTTFHDHFHTETFELNDGDSIYAFTDGYADQFGGPDNKKFMKGRFKNLLLSVQDKAMQHQLEILEQTFNDWKGENDSIDDVTVVGIRYRKTT